MSESRPRPDWTPTPWVAVPTTRRSSRADERRDIRGDGGSRSYVVAGYVREADARLIERAPELMRMLLRLLAHLRQDQLPPRELVLAAGVLVRKALAAKPSSRLGAVLEGVSTAPADPATPRPARRAGADYAVTSGDEDPWT